MGEYATYKGESIKIGTCEDMYYLRADQVRLVTPERGSLNPATCRVIRFRFPFPDEDNIEPGGFDDYDRSQGLEGIQPPSGIEHYKIQFESHPRGLFCSLPCLFDSDNPPPVKIQRNGYVRGGVRIVQQRVWDGHLALVCQCGPCGARYRLETLADAEPVIVKCRSEADRYRPCNGGPTDKWWNTVADRIIAGYTQPLPF